MAELRAKLGKVAPGEPVTLVQMAAMVSVESCQQDPAQAHFINVEATGSTVAAFVDLATAQRLVPSVLFTSTGHVYRPDSRHRLDELAPVDPQSVYAETKLQGERAITTIAEGQGTEAMIARIFGIVGPDQPPNYVLPGLISRVRASRLAGIPGLHNLRDYLDTRDVCRHLVGLARDLQTRGPRGTRIVNLCSGEATAIEEILNRVLEIQYSGDQDRLARARSEVSAAPGRPTDAHRVVGDPTRLLALVRKPIRSIPLSRTVLDAMAV